MEVEIDQSTIRLMIKFRSRLLRLATVPKMTISTGTL